MIEAISSVQALSASSELKMSSATSVQDTKATPKVSFTEALKETAMDQVSTVAKSEQMTMAAMNGKASLQDVVQATVQAEMAVETAIAVRNKLIEGYQEIMRMPV